MPVGVNPIERRIMPADERDGTGAAMGAASSGKDREGSSFGFDSTCHRSDVVPGRASRGAMLMEAYLRWAHLGESEHASFEGVVRTQRKKKCTLVARVHVLLSGARMWVHRGKERLKGKIGRGPFFVLKHSK